MRWWLPSATSRTSKRMAVAEHGGQPAGTGCCAERWSAKGQPTTAYTQTVRSSAACLPPRTVRLAPSWQWSTVRRDTNTQFGGPAPRLPGYGYRINPAWRAQGVVWHQFCGAVVQPVVLPGFNNPLLQTTRKNTDVGLTPGHNRARGQAGARYNRKIRGYITNTTLLANIPQSCITGWTLSWQKASLVPVRASVRCIEPCATRRTAGQLLPAWHQTTLGLPTGLCAMVRRCCGGRSGLTTRPTRAAAGPPARWTCMPTGSRRTGARRARSIT